MIHFRNEAEVLFLQMSEQEYHQWRHHPVTAAYLRYLQEQVEVWRTVAADLLVVGNLDLRQSDVIRGRILTFQELADLDLGSIKNFYRQEGTDGTASD